MAKSKQVQLTAGQIERALRHSRHADDIVVPECKTGPSQGIKHYKIDLWAMRRSYSKPLISAYEIKVSRSDFLQDTKWTNYLPYCNQFYWATPWKLVMPEEVSGDAGLVWVTNTGNRCVVKKKAAHRDMKLSLDPPYDLFIYLLYSRAAFMGEDEGGRAEKLSRWKFWMDQSKEAEDFGHWASKKIRQTINEEIKKVRKENEALRNENKTLTDIREFVVNDLEVDPKRLRDWMAYHEVRMVKNRLNMLDKCLDGDLGNTLQRVYQDAKMASSKLEEALINWRKLKEGEEPDGKDRTTTV